MNSGSEDIHYLMEESSARFHPRLGRRSCSQRQSKGGINAKRPLFNRNPPSSSGEINLQILSSYTYIRNECLLNKVIPPSGDDGKCAHRIRPCLPKPLLDPVAGVGRYVGRSHRLGLQLSEPMLLFFVTWELIFVCIPSCLIEFPSAVLSSKLSDIFGRCLSASCLHFFTACSLISIQFLSIHLVTMKKTSTAFFGKSTLTTALCIVDLYLVEVVPTNILTSARTMHSSWYSEDGEAASPGLSFSTFTLVISTSFIQATMVL
ncbi:unnamed protein product [Protopolystoma xenopodis]|uniref:Uncharacterized protein n=1 Tax=Protopolystoma xenopodis TaxID=117903 RepID=A0A448WFH9_9PLAT|nr:unnamed protein product [Protopolystoma xenopodis]